MNEDFVVALGWIRVREINDIRIRKGVIKYNKNIPIIHMNKTMTNPCQKVTQSLHATQSNTL